MEFVGEYTKNTSPGHIEKFNDLQGVFLRQIRAVPLTDEPAAQATLDAFVEKNLMYDKIRFRMVDSFDAAVNDYNVLKAKYEATKKLAPKMAQAIETRYHYMYITLPETSFRWPVQNLDVVPALDEDLRELLILIHSRKQPGIAPNLRPRKINPTAIRADHGLFVNENYEDTKTILSSVNKYVDALAKMIKTPKVDTPTIKFVFDTREYLRRLPQYRFADGVIHKFNVIYDILGWDYITAEHSVNYKIASWLSYDIMSHLIEGTQRDLVIYLCDDSAAALSFFFVNLGKRTCKFNILFEFVDMVEDEAPSDFKISRGGPREQIVSTLAFYFTYFHEIWRKNTIIGKRMQPSFMYETPGAVINKMTRAPTFRAAETVFLTTKEHFKSIKYPEMTAEEIAAAIGHYSEELLKKGKRSPGGPFVKVVAASPGVGKSTIIRGMHDYIRVDRDDIITSIKISGKTITEHLLDVEKYIDEQLTYPFMGHFKALLKHSIQLGLRGVVFANYIKAYEKNIIPAIYNIIKENKYDMIIEGIGYEISTTSRQDLINTNSCAEILSHSGTNIFYNNTCHNATCSADIVYISPVLQYNRQCLRYEAEHRIARYYTLTNYSSILWSEIAHQWKDKVSITCIGIDGITYKIVNNGEMNWDKLDAYLRRNIIDYKFAKFLNKEYRALISPKTIRHRLVW